MVDRSARDSQNFGTAACDPEPFTNLVTAKIRFVMGRIYLEKADSLLTKSFYGAVLSVINVEGSEMSGYRSDPGKLKALLVRGYSPISP
jgi:hypothetical protein